ncbi:HAD family hydrolase [Haloarchaeobius litoreus]|uniref:HAD family hydrolase n=1 Tax=Haloarchaeobius litoreus TaxID=755306 RepID=A0ABD6DJ53_9EURY|nr:HAD family hydrolase [Haloarchaeobius litoreus]
MTEPVDTVLFDLDDTLCRYRRSVGEVLSIAFEEAGVEPMFDERDYVANYDDYAEQAADIDELRRLCFADLASDRGLDPAAGHAVADAYTATRDQTAVEPLPGAVDAVDALADDHRLAIVTNGAPGMQRAKLSALPFADRFEHVVHAGYDTAAKPAPEPFHHVLDLLDADADRAVHVGNSLSSDVQGAHAAGLRSVWLGDGSTPEPTPTYAVDRLDELLVPPWR